MSGELLPCPFCGTHHRPHLLDGKRLAVSSVYYWCSVCGVSTSLFHYDPAITSGREIATEQAAAAWNRRACAVISDATDRMARRLGAEFVPFDTMDGPFGPARRPYVFRYEDEDGLYLNVNGHCISLDHLPESEQSLILADPVLNPTGEG